MQQIDPNFEEKNAGYNRFSKFLVEAGNRKLLRVTKMEHGQYDIGPLETVAPGPVAASPPAPEAVRGEEGARRGRGRGRSRGRGRESAAPASAPADSAPAPRRDKGEKALTLAQAFDLLRHALSELPSPSGGEAVRNRMAALFGKSDPLLESERFHRFLRQAHDAEVADVRMVGDNQYEVTTRPGFRYERPVQTPLATVEPVASEPRPRAAAGSEMPTESGAANGKRAGIRFRRGSRGVMARADVPMVGVVKVEEPAQPAAPAESSGKTRKPRKAAKSPRARKPKAEVAVPATAAGSEPPPAGAKSPDAPRRPPRRPRAKKS
jgi:hypothetical protein